MDKAANHDGGERCELDAEGRRDQPGGANDGMADSSGTGETDAEASSLGEIDMERSGVASRVDSGGGKHDDDGVGHARQTAGEKEAKRSSALPPRLRGEGGEWRGS